MYRRISFFVSQSVPAPDGWRLAGDVGLGPSEVGDEFTFVHDDDTGTDESLSLRVLALAGSDLLVAGGGGELIRPGDILLAEITDRATLSAVRLAQASRNPPSRARSVRWSADRRVLGTGRPRDPRERSLRVDAAPKLEAVVRTGPLPLYERLIRRP